MYHIINVVQHPSELINSEAMVSIAKTIVAFIWVIQIATENFQISNYNSKSNAQISM